MDGDSLVGNVNSNNGQLKLDRSNGNANSNDGVGLSVRHTLNPQAYVRYGDDFLLFYPTRRQAFAGRRCAADFLATELQLTVNPKNDVVVPAGSGLKFLVAMT